jgi:hypothetical protein
VTTESGSEAEVDSKADVMDAPEVVEEIVDTQPSPSVTEAPEEPQEDKTQEDETPNSLNTAVDTTVITTTTTKEPDDDELEEYIPPLLPPT